MQKVNEEDECALNSTETSRAESLWIKTVQASSFKWKLKFVQTQHQPKPWCVEQFGQFGQKQIGKMLRTAQ